MARNESRAESIKRLCNAEIRKVKSFLKDMGITVPDIEGPSEDDMDLRNLQEWQAIGKAVDDHKSAQEKSATADNSFSSGVDFSSPAAIDSASKPKKGI